MGRKPAEKRDCSICGDAANGINFGCASCLSCKAFFRRNANRKDKQFRCPFSSKCEINHLTRKFCAKCRLEKCFSSGMKRELILNEDEREALKSKIKRNREQKQKEFNEAIRRATQKYQRSESEVGAILHSLTLKNRTTSMSSQAPGTVQNSVDAEIMSEFNGFFKPRSGPNCAIEPKTELSEGCSAVDPLDLDRYLEAFGAPSFENLSDIEQILDMPSANNLSSSANTEYFSENSSLSSPYSSFSPDHTSSSSSSNQELVSYNWGHQSNLTSNNFASKYDSILNFIPIVQASSVSSAAGGTSLPLEIGFPEDDLLMSEKYLLKEIYSAGSLLRNPYKRISEFAHLDIEYSGRMTEFILYRLIRMSKQLSGFASKTKELQGKMLKHGLIEMMVLQSVLMYNEYRDAWAFLDDNYQISVMFPTASIAPFCHKYGFQRHKALPKRFRSEWKDDRVLFDILTALILFTPRPEYTENEQSIQEEYQRYYRLLHRYLRIKYPSPSEADECFFQLMSNITEVFHLSEDIFEFFKIHQVRFQRNPFFVELLDLPMLSHFEQAEHQSHIEEITNESNNESLSSNSIGFNSFVEEQINQQNNFAIHQPVEVPQTSTGIGNFWL